MSDEQRDEAELNPNSWPKVKEAPRPALAAALTVHARIDDGRTIEVITYVDRDADPGEYNAVLDKLIIAIERQQARYDLKTHYRYLEQQITELAQREEDYKSIGDRAVQDWKAKGKRGDPKMSASEQQNKITSEVNIRRFRESIDKRKADIENLEAVLAG